MDSRRRRPRSRLRSRALNPPPNSAELLATERRLAKPAGFAAVLGVVLFIASALIQSSAGGENLDTDAGLLTQFSEDGSTLLVSRVVYALAFLSFTLPLYTLFRAIQARTDRVRNHFVAFCFIGPVLLAIQGPVNAIGSKTRATSSPVRPPPCRRWCRRAEPTLR